MRDHGPRTLLVFVLVPALLAAVLPLAAGHPDDLCACGHSKQECCCQIAVKPGSHCDKTGRGASCAVRRPRSDAGTPAAAGAEVRALSGVLAAVPEEMPDAPTGTLLATVEALPDPPFLPPDSPPPRPLLGA